MDHFNWHIDPVCHYTHSPRPRYLLYLLTQAGLVCMVQVVCLVGNTYHNRTQAAKQNKTVKKIILARTE